MNSQQLTELIEQVLKEGNFEIVEYPNINNDPINYERFLEFSERLYKKINH